MWDAIIIGSGLAGLSVALEVLDAGGRVLLLEKESKLGGNSMKASSGINAVASPDDLFQIDAFRKDTRSSAGVDSDLKMAQNSKLIDTLVEHSHESVLQWLTKRLDVDLSQVSQLGGHSYARTFRPGGKLPIGAEIMIKLQRALRAFEIKDEVDSSETSICHDSKNKNGIKILTKTKALQILNDEKTGAVIGVMYQHDGDEETDKQQSKSKVSVYAPAVVLATGGFAADRSKDSWLAKVHPDLLHFGVTAGSFSTGDGLSLAVQNPSLQANAVGLEHIQLHPTGFVNPKDPNNPNKILAAEVLRGEGAILLNSDGKRFCNEMGRRDYVTDQILALPLKGPVTTEKNSSPPPPPQIPQVFLVLSEEVATKLSSHVDFYVSQGLLRKVVGIENLSRSMNITMDEETTEQMTTMSSDILHSTLWKYCRDAEKGHDEFGKTNFPAIPFLDEDGKEGKKGVYYVGNVEPVLHYCMGGLEITPQGNVIQRRLNTIGVTENYHAVHDKPHLNADDDDDDRKHSTIIKGLYACGEVAGGLHGKNRLAGNSLCECVVFGRIVGKEIISLVLNEKAR